MVKPAPKSQGFLGSGATYRVIQEEEERTPPPWVGGSHQNQRNHGSVLAAFSLSNQGAWFGKGPKIITQRGREQRQVIIPEKYRGFSK